MKLCVGGGWLSGGGSWCNSGWSGRGCWMLWVLVVLVMEVLVGVEEVAARKMVPCWGPQCHYRHYRVKRLKQRSVPDENTGTSTTCNYACNCDNNTDGVNCQAGVRMIQDGCGCCYICARQQGELCNHEKKCDEAKDLYCDYKRERVGENGICRARSARPCYVEGQTYKDGEHFTPDCRRLCSCQNGRYACTSRCTHEDRAPSSHHCINAQLVSIEGQCCKQWVCGETRTHNAHVSIDRPQQSGPHRECTPVTTPWSPCSETCGMGESLRTTNENAVCAPRIEVRLCMIRPCGLAEQQLNDQNGRCKTTWRPEQPIRFTYDGCFSVREYRPKYCSTCKRNRCCRPDNDKLIDMEFECPSHSYTRKQFQSFAWIKSCVCDTECD